MIVFGVRGAGGVRAIVLGALIAFAMVASPTGALADTAAPFAWNGGAVIDPVPYPQFGATGFEPTMLNRLSCPSAGCA